MVLKKSIEDLDVSKTDRQLLVSPNTETISSLLEDQNIQNRIEVGKSTFIGQRRDKIFVKPKNFQKARKIVKRFDKLSTQNVRQITKAFERTGQTKKFKPLFKNE